jgi:hypothetical protein
MENDTPPPLPEISINLSSQLMTGAARFAVFESLLGSLVFSLQQCPRQVHELRSWKKKFEEAEENRLIAGGKRTPRGLVCRRALSFITRYDAMIEGAKLAFNKQRVLQTLILLGPCSSAPRFVLHIKFEEGNLGCPPMQHIYRSIHEIRNTTDENNEIELDSKIENTITDGKSSSYISSLEETESLLTTRESQFSTSISSLSHLSSTTSTTGIESLDYDEDREESRKTPLPVPLLLESYQQPLEKSVQGLIARTAARQLIVEAQTVYGMQPVALNKIHILIQTQQLVHDHQQHRDISSTVISSSSLVDKRIDDARIADSHISSEESDLRSHFFPKPYFTLRQPRKRIVRMVREEQVLDNKEEKKEDDEHEHELSIDNELDSKKRRRCKTFRLVRKHDWSSPKYRLVTANVSGQPVIQARTIDYKVLDTRIVSSIPSFSSLSSTSSDTISSSVPSVLSLHSESNYKLEWYYWNQPPQAFKGSLPNPTPLPKPIRQTHLQQQEQEQLGVDKK